MKETEVNAERLRLLLDPTWQDVDRPVVQLDLIAAIFPTEPACIVELFAMSLRGKMMMGA